MRYALLLLATSSCLFSQSANCGEDYERNMTRVKPGLYKLDRELAGVTQLRISVSDETVDVTTADGRTARYRR